MHRENTKFAFAGAEPGFWVRGSESQKLTNFDPPKGQGGPKFC